MSNRIPGLIIKTTFFLHPFHVGMEALISSSQIQQPIDHDYICTASPTLVDTAVQTSMTMEDIKVLEDSHLTQLSTSPGEDVVGCATETDERVNFYTGLPSKNILHGMFTARVNYIKSCLL